MNQIVIDGPLEEYRLPHAETRRGASFVDDLRSLTGEADAQVLTRRWGPLQERPRLLPHREPVARWVAAAERIRLIIDLKHVLDQSTSRRDPAATDLLRVFMSEQQLTPAGLDSPDLNPATLDPERLGELYLIALMNEGLSHVHEGLYAASLITYDVERADDGRDQEAMGLPGHLFQLARCDNLLGWAYFTLKQNMLAGHQTRRCSFCGRPFIPEHGGTRYCSKPCLSRAREQSRRPRAQ